MNLLLDTNAWIWWNTTHEELSDPALGAISNVQPEDRLCLSAISVWEVCKLVEKGRLKLGRDIRHWLEVALDIEGLELLPLTPDIAVESTCLPDFHSDPADQIIVATARIHNLVLITADQAIQAYPHVRTLW